MFNDSMFGLISLIFLRNTSKSVATSLANKLKVIKLGNFKL